MTGRTFILMAVGISVFAILIGSAVFFIAVHGVEQTMTPDVVGKDLISALLELQEKELYPRLQMRSSQEKRGSILEQEPTAGALVKAGRRIRLVVSQGIILNTIEDYRGRSIDEVRAEIQTLFASTDFPLLNIKEPFMAQSSKEPSGTIIEQRPEPGTPVSSAVALEFVVSKGEENATMKVPNFTGLTMEACLEQINKTDVDFAFDSRPAQDGEKSGIVASQTPLPDIETEESTRIKLMLTEPEIQEGETFGIFTYTLPKNPYPIRIEISAITPDGSKLSLLKANFPGGDLSVPYKIPIGSTLILSMLDRELFRKTVF
ncbi:MAG: PASTA domain-containing protein [Treponema sp.]|jgi:beta-lactam-binding protein with PASTA domain|nr:PASTA domain-containing protein [Treponema sp.]